MKIEILKGEYLISEQGTHICDENGFAMVADSDVECEVDAAKYDSVVQLLVEARASRGLDQHGMPLPSDKPPVEIPPSE